MTQRHLQIESAAKMVLYSGGSIGSRQKISMCAPLARWKCSLAGTTLVSLKTIIGGSNCLCKKEVQANPGKISLRFSLNYSEAVSKNHVREGDISLSSRQEAYNYNPQFLCQESYVRKQNYISMQI